MQDEPFFFVALREHEVLGLKHGNWTSAEGVRRVFSIHWIYLDILPFGVVSHAGPFYPQMCSKLQFLGWGRMMVGSQIPATSPLIVFLFSALSFFSQSMGPCPRRPVSIGEVRRRRQRRRVPAQPRGTEPQEC